MKLFSQKETIQQNIAFMAIFSAINIILSLISALVPFVSIFLFLLMPLTSVVVTIFCKLKFYPIYFCASILLSFIVTIWNSETTLFYLLPSLVTGFLFGLMLKKKVPSIYSLLATSLTQMGFLLLFIPLTNFLYGTDLVISFKTLFNLNESQNIDVIIPAFLLLVSFIQMSLSYVVIFNELNKLGIKDNKDAKYQWIYQLILFVSSLLIILFSFVYVPISFVLLIINIFIGIKIIFDYVVLKYYRVLIIFASGLILNIMIFALGYSLLGSINGFLLIGFTPFWISFISLIVSFLKRESKKVE